MAQPFRFIAVAASIAAATASFCATAQPIAPPGTEGYSVIAGGGDIVATYLGSTASYSDDLLLNGVFIYNNYTTPVGTQVDLGTYTAGTELIFELRVNTTGNVWYSGPASRNADDMPHARVESNYLVAGTTLVSFEDLAGDPEGVNGFNDLSFSFSGTVGSPTPEPETWALMIGGLLAVGAVARRRQRG